MNFLIKVYLNVIVIKLKVYATHLQGTGVKSISNESPLFNASVHTPPLYCDVKESPLFNASVHTPPSIVM